MKITSVLFPAALLLVCLVTSATGQSSQTAQTTPLKTMLLGQGQTPVEFRPTKPFSARGGRLVIRGENKSTKTQTVVIRIDDTQSTGYSSRVNIERKIFPGPFYYSALLRNLRTPQKSPLNVDAIKLIVVSPWPETRDISIQTFELSGIKPNVQRKPPSTAVEPQPTTRRTLGPNGTIAIGSLPLLYEPNQPTKLSPDDQIVIEGIVRKQAATVVLRVDDRRSPSYVDRMNDERSLPPGPFRIVRTAASLKTGRGTPLDLSKIHQMLLFSSPHSNNVSITKFAITRAKLKVAGNKTKINKSLSLGIGTAPIRYRPARAFSGVGKQLVIEGTNKATNSQTIVVRVDDQFSRNYATRVNLERQIPPGPFSLRVPIDGLRTPQKRVIDAKALKLVLLGPWPETSNIVLNRFDLAPIKRLPPGVVAFSFGPANATLPPGFKRIAPGDPRILGSSIQARRRPNPDPIVASGIRGIEQVTLKVSPGRKRVTVWSEDPGEWENLPRALNRSIRVNGKILLKEQLSSQQWLANRYLASRWRDHDSNTDAWTAYGRHRGSAKSVVVNARGTITITLDGDTLNDRYISAVLIEPASTTTNAKGTKFVTNHRANWYRNNWRTSPNIKDAHKPKTARSARVHTYHLAQSNAQDVNTLAPVAATVTPGTGSRLTLSFTTDLSAIANSKTKIKITPPSGLSVRAWAAQWRLERPEPHATQLDLRDDRLVAELERLALSATQPRRYELWVKAPKRIKPGDRTGSIELTVGKTRYRLPLEITVLDINLPAVRKPVGAYLAYAPHLTWFRTPKTTAAKQAACDMRTLAGFGLTGTAPAVTVPYRGGTTEFEAEMRAARAGGITPNWLVYNPLHQMRLNYGLQRAAKFAAGANRALKKRGFPLPVWSAADEPSNADQNSSELRTWIKTLRRYAGSEINLAGHFNAPVDVKFADLFDTLIINPSFGLDRNQIAKLSTKRRQVWFYNTFRPRLTAGLWLHFAKATRYIQWHARMPTADPLDPIDGREADVQLLYPSLILCPDQPDIHRDLLRLAEGIVDQRWLVWLDKQKTSQAKKVRTAIHARIPDKWSEAEKWTAADMQNIRKQIMTLAQTKR